jgi:hypothetical protein
MRSRETLPAALMRAAVAAELSDLAAGTVGVSERVCILSVAPHAVCKGTSMSSDHAILTKCRQRALVTTI